VVKVNALEPEMQSLTDEQLAAKTADFKARLSGGATLDDLLPEAFAVVREVSFRTMGMRHFDAQLIGGMVLHDGKIAEMRTGEGKTLMSTLAAYLNALTGNGMHVVTVNDYLAKRDAEWMSPIYEFLGLTVGVNTAGLNQDEKKAAYAADITYGTNNEFGFDYLRDNMVYDLNDRVQRPLNYAVIDEVDSILIDEARTPLIISGQAEESSVLYAKLNKLIPLLKRQIMSEGQKEEEVPEDKRGDYTLDEKSRQAFLTEQGHHNIEKLLVKEDILKEGDSLYDVNNISTMHYVFASLRAHTLFQRDVHYVVKDDEVMIVDEHTGRLMQGRRWSDGLHQAVEAKEGVKIQLENQTLATITLQNYFRLFKKLAGMTGTADTEAYEFQKIYGLEVVVIPTNKAMVREDRQDCVFLSQNGKYDAILADIRKCIEKQQPVLVGTASIENSELISLRLTKEKIPHEVLNAKQHEREAKIIAEAGRPGAVTIATNMAGRGTDIVLGGSLEAELEELGDATPEEIEQHKAKWKERHATVIAAGGLHVLGTERHESRRIDNQLRGRSGRQGDPGSSQFFLSLEDNLLRIFAAERMQNLMRRLGVKEGDVISHPWINRAIENAQRRVEGLNFDIRKNLLEFDDVANDQRKVIYQQRFELLQKEDISETVESLREEAIETMVHQFVPPETIEEQWDIIGLEQQIELDFGLKLPISQWLQEEADLNGDTLIHRITNEVKTAYDAKMAEVDPETRKNVEKSFMIQILDTQWKDHLASMEHLRQGIHLRGYAQKNPTQEFKREAFNLFSLMLDNIKYDYISTLSKMQIAPEKQYDFQPQSMPKMHYQHDEMASLSMMNEAAGVPVPQEEGVAVSEQPFIRHQPKVGRNDACPCGSGKKYKQCHGKFD
jgi:preprotein translocase subunit SecA